MLDHIYISVSDVPRSLAFYAAALAPLGWRELGRYDSATGPAGIPDLHGLADEAEVNAAYAAAIHAGGTSEGAPAIREYFGPSYYAANIADFDGNHLEIVHKTFNPPSRQHLLGGGT